MDIWSLGCVVLDMLTQGKVQYVDRDGIPLSRHLPYSDWLASMQNGGQPVIPDSAPDIIRRFCQNCFERDPELYLTAKELTNSIVREKNYAEETDMNNSAVTRGVKVNSRDRKALALKVLHSAGIVVEKQTLLLQIEHPFMVKYLAIGRLPFGPNGVPNPQTGVLMEYCEGGTLNELSRSTELSEADILKYLWQIVSAVHYLHERPLPIFHGDIKGENIFLTQDQAICKLGEWKNFHILVEGKTNVGGLKVKQGTLLHMSPEMLVYAFGTDDEDQALSTGIGRASDIWSVGWHVLEMVEEGSSSTSLQMNDNNSRFGQTEEILKASK
ncbi:hypothetical protein BV898_09764 [Hypsibius exemplaris]|uniref:non-specific serine/threonine protein kinase n=1 Tax=Hypsibius exemplaris TaxID=2072580 RepID=A0A1W0WLQ7_HYPEX|nr:hypothetical protein BV898_09764 [Hypsibius exemplaris]